MLDKPKAPHGSGGTRILGAASANLPRSTVAFGDLDRKHHVIASSRVYRFRVAYVTGTSSLRTATDRADSGLFRYVFSGRDPVMVWGRADFSSLVQPQGPQRSLKQLNISALRAAGIPLGPR
jgi:hypothetical protein